MRTIAVWAVVIVLVGVGVAVWLLLAYTGGDVEANRVQLDAIRTAGTIVVGTGGAAALLLAARRQRSTEIALRQTDREQVTDLYAKAVEQLGSEKAPVRLGGLYALERLAQDNPSQRQTIVNVLCAYLRMPYTLPGDPPPDDADDTTLTAHRERVQEREVRLTAQRLLRTHLHPGYDAHQPATTLWTNIELDLTGATLIDFDLSDCVLGIATFVGAIFTGLADFSSATFTSYAGFVRATFTGIASFSSVTFTGPANFDLTTFTDLAHFSRATFNGATFSSATFAREAAFDWATFTGPANFSSATFTGPADFDVTTFTDPANFHSATFAEGVPPEVEQFWSPREEIAAGTAGTDDGVVDADGVAGTTGPTTPTTG